MRLKRNSPRYGKGKITNIWEVQISVSLAEKIRKVASSYGVSMSWVVRYCVFQLVHSECTQLSNELEDVIHEIKQSRQNRADIKRFFLCLYGDDELHLRLAARNAGLTVSMLIRLALFLYLDELVGGNISYGKLFWEGIKFAKEMTLARPIRTVGSVQDFLNRRLFDYHDFWGIPPGTARHIPPAA